MRLIVGLGNPGEEYKLTRHNVGFMILDKIVKTEGLSWQINKKLKAEICKVGDVVYVKPLTFMNNSGQAVAAIMAYYNLLPKKLGILKKKDSNLSSVLTVIHDEMDLLFGKCKLSIDSRSAGHNGVQSVIDCLKTKNFQRLRIGINNKPEKMPTEKYVLQKFSPDELEKVKNLLPAIIKML